MKNIRNESVHGVLKIYIATIIFFLILLENLSCHLYLLQIVTRIMALRLSDEHIITVKK